MTSSSVSTTTTGASRIFDEHERRPELRPDRCESLVSVDPVDDAGINGRRRMLTPEAS